MGAPFIEDKDDLISYFRSGEKPKHQWKVGTEHEKFPFFRTDQTPLPYEGPYSITRLMEILEQRGWRVDREDGHPMAAYAEDGRSLTLEPGGQIELSGAPLATIHETYKEIYKHHQELADITADWGVNFVGMGFHPFAKISDLPKVPKQRYAIMRAYMTKVGTLGLDMMHRTCTVQANLDYASEQDCIMKFQTALALQPVATALFANSPFLDGKPNGYRSNRAHMWMDTDNARSGFVPGAFQDDFGYAAYTEYALNTPMYFVKRGGKSINCAGLSFRDFLDGKLSVLPGERPTMSDWADHVSTLFPDVRLKTYIEMRGADSGRLDALCALPALWVGLLYDQESLREAHEWVMERDSSFWQTCAQIVPQDGLSAVVDGVSVQELAQQMVHLAAQGLRRRGRLNDVGQSEEVFVEFLEGIAQSGRSVADRLREQWERSEASIRQIFMDQSY